MNTERILSAIYRYGEKIKILSGDSSEIETKAFIEPLRYRNRLYIGGSQLPDGYLDGGRHFLLICPKKADLTLRDTVILRSSGEKYVVKRADDMVFAGKTLYVWAVLTLFNPQKEDCYDAVL